MRSRILIVPFNISVSSNSLSFSLISDFYDTLLLPLRIQTSACRIYRAMKSGRMFSESTRRRRYAGWPKQISPSRALSFAARTRACGRGIVARTRRVGRN